MKDLLGRILEIEEVQGVLLVSFEGNVLFQDDSPTITTAAEKSGIWARLFETMDGIREADLIFEQTRLYLRKTDMGYLLVVTGLFAPAAMVRMHCDLVLPFLRQNSKPKGLKKLFGKKS